MARFKITQRTKGELLALSTPDNPNQPEVLPWTLYDTQAYTSTATVQLPFFTATSGDKSICNMESAGQLPDPQFFELHYLTCDFLHPGVSTDAAAKGNLDDIYQLLNAGRGTFELNLSNKRYGPFPLAMAHASGGPIGAVSSTVATSSQQVGVNGVQDGGFYFGGQIIIPPKVGFDVTLRWGVAATLKTTPLNIRIGLTGVLYRRVL